MTNPSAVRRRFIAAMALYVAWVGVLAAMAITSSYRPPKQILRSAEGAPAAANAPNP